MLASHLSEEALRLRKQLQAHSDALALSIVRTDLKDQIALRKASTHKTLDISV